LDDWEKQWKKNQQGIVKPAVVQVDFLGQQASDAADNAGVPSVAAGHPPATSGGSCDACPDAVKRRSDRFVGFRVPETERLGIHTETPSAGTFPRGTLPDPRSACRRPPTPSHKTHTDLGAKRSWAGHRALPVLAIQRRDMEPLRNRRRCLFQCVRWDLGGRLHC
jgi:hypothetical protein